MNKRKLFILSLVASCLVLVLSGCRKTEQDSWSNIEKRGRIIVGLDDSFVPMGFRQKDGTLTGFDVDLAKEVGKELHLKVDFQTIDWSMKETELRNQTIDLIWNGYTKTKARAKQVAFSQPYLGNSQVVVTMKKQNIQEISELKDKNLGVQSGSSGLNDLEQAPNMLENKLHNKTPILYDSFNEALIDLRVNRIQGLLIDQVYADYYVSKQADPSAYRIIETNFPKESFAIGIRKQDQKVQQKINRALTKLEQNGTIGRLKAKWFGPATNEKQ